jgi:hypothetical protein
MKKLNLTNEMKQINVGPGFFDFPVYIVSEDGSVKALDGNPQL